LRAGRRPDDRPELRAPDRLVEARALLAPARGRVGVRVAMLAGYPYTTLVTLVTRITAVPRVAPPSTPEMITVP
jgi:hypothetical protein